MTFEDVKRIRNNPTVESCDIKELQKLIDIAIEKQIPKNPENIRQIGTSFDVRTRKSVRYFVGFCKVCKTRNTTARVEEKITYCENCGQALDWGDFE